MEEIKQISEKIGRTLEDAGKHIKELEGKARDQVDIDKKSLRKEDKLSISQAKAQRQERHRKHMQTKDDVALMPSLIKLADLIICESIIASLLSSGEAMLRLLRSQEWRSASVYKGVFETSVDFHGKNVVVVPESATVVDAIGDVCEAAVTSLYSMPRVYGTSVYRYLLPFLVTDDDPEPERECIDPAAIVEGSVVWRGCLESMGEVVQSSFTMAEEQTRRLESKLAMHEFIQRMEEDGEAMIDELLHPHGTPDPENLAVQMRQLKSWMRGMETVKKVAVCGALSVDMRGIKNYLISKSKEIYGRMLQALKDIARAMLNAVRQEMDGRLKSLTARPKMLEDFVHFHRSFAETLSRRQELVEQVDAVDSVYELVSLASSEEAVPDSDQADRRGLAIVQEQILVEIERAEAFLSAQRGPMLQALEARKQVVDQELLNIVMQLNTGKYSDPNQAANEICEALVKLESQLAR